MDVELPTTTFHIFKKYVAEFVSMALPCQQQQYDSSDTLISPSVE